jgi:arylsulfatase
MRRGFEDPPIDGPAGGAVRSKLVYRSGNIGMKVNAIPLRDHSHVIVAEVFMPGPRADGILLTQRGRFGGCSFFVRDGRLWYTGNGSESGYFGFQSELELPVGTCCLAIEFCRWPRLAFREPGPGATGRMFINGSLVAKAGFPAARSTVREIEGEPLFCGHDGSGLHSPDYLLPFRFSGVIRKLTVDISGDPYDPGEVLKPNIEIVH